MTTMPIDNHPLTQRRLQLIGIGVNKLTLKSINIISSVMSISTCRIYNAWPSLKHCRTVVNYVQGDHEAQTKCRLKEGYKLSVHR